jgi:hypothetical protein
MEVGALSRPPSYKTRTLANPLHAGARNVIVSNPTESVTSRIWCNLLAFRVGVEIYFRIPVFRTSLSFPLTKLESTTYWNRVEPIDKPQSHMVPSVRSA